MDELIKEYPGRSRQIETLINWFGEPTEKTPHSIFIHGNRALGKTEIIKKLFKIRFSARTYSILNCKIYFQLEDIFEASLNHLSGKKHRCKNFDEFATIIQNICETSEETRYLIFDNAELLWNFSQTIVSSLLTLPHWVGANLCIIFITQAPWEKFRRYVGIIEPFQLHFPEYSRSDVIQILEKTCPKDEDIEFYNSFVNYVYNVFSDSCDLIDLFRVVPDLYTKLIQSTNEESVDYSLLFNELNPHIEFTLDNLHLQHIAPLIENQLPTWSLYLLIAAFLASYIPQSLDKYLFSNEHENQKNSRKKRRKESTALKFNELFTGPQASETERILAIFQSIYQDSIIPYILLLQQLETFTTYHLFTRTTPIERKDVQLFRCNASFSYIKQISKSINFNIFRYLDDSSTL